jgi:hypothetical protein
MDRPKDRPSTPSRLPFAAAYWIVVGPLILLVIIAALVANLKFRADRSELGADRYEALERARQSEATQPRRGA